MPRVKNELVPKIVSRQAEQQLSGCRQFAGGLQSLALVIVIALIIFPIVDDTVVLKHLEISVTLSRCKFRHAIVLLRTTRTSQQCPNDM